MSSNEANETENSVEKNQEYQHMVPPTQIPLQPPPFGPMYPMPTMAYPHQLAFPTPGPYPFPTQMGYPPNISPSMPQVQCRFGRRCLRADCHFLHAEGREIDENPQKVRNSRPPCHFGRKCRRPDCFFQHPEGRDIDELTGSSHSTSSTTSEPAEVSGFTTDEIAQINAALEDMVNQEVLDSLTPEDREAYLQMVNEPSDDEDDIDLDAVANELGSSKTPEPETQAKNSQ